MHGNINDVKQPVHTHTDGQRLQPSVFVGCGGGIICSCVNTLFSSRNGKQAHLIFHRQKLFIQIWYYVPTFHGASYPYLDDSDLHSV